MASGRAAGTWGVGWGWGKVDRSGADGDGSHPTCPGLRKPSRWSASGLRAFPPLSLSLGPPFPSFFDCRVPTPSLCFTAKTPVTRPYFLLLWTSLSPYNDHDLLSPLLRAVGSPGANPFSGRILLSIRARRNAFCYCCHLTERSMGVQSDSVARQGCAERVCRAKLWLWVCPPCGLEAYHASLPSLMSSSRGRRGECGYSSVSPATKMRCGTRETLPRAKHMGP